MEPGRHEGAVVCTYLVTEDQLSMSFSGPAREVDVTIAVKNGARIILTQEFAPEITEYERAQFREGLYAGYWAAIRGVRAALGIQA